MRPPTAARQTALVRARRSLRPGDAARRLRDILRANVFADVYPDGLLPGENELMLAHGVRRAAVRDALAMLRAEGVVERVQGVGTFAVRRRAASPLAELHGEPAGGVMEAQSRPRILDRSVVAAPDFVVERLGLEAGEQVLRLEYVAFVDGEPCGLATNYVTFPEAEPLLDARFDQDFYTLLRDCGVVLGGTEWVLSTVNADAEVAELLNVAEGQALMVGEELIWDEQGRVYDFAVCYMRTDRHVISSTSWTISPRRAAR